MEIFLVEDSPLLRSRLAEMLGAIPGAAVVGEAERADVAIREILAARPDVVVLDLSLAGVTSGFEVLRALCREAPEIDVYMLSNFVAEPYRELAERLGAREFFDKTGDLERVRRVIAERAAAAMH